MILALLAALGRAERLEAIRRGFTSKTEPDSNVWPNMLAVALIGLMVIAGLLILNRIQQGRQVGQKGNARSLFREVLQKLPLGFLDRVLLRRVAKAMALENPTVMLLTPQLFAEISHRYVATKRGRANADMIRLRAICEQLFGLRMPRPAGPAKRPKP